MALHGPLGKALGLAERVAPEVGRGALNVATLGAYEHPHDSVQYVIDTLKSMDPRTRAGVLNLAATFVPGPGRSGKFIGQLDPIQAAYMRQLGGGLGMTRDYRPSVGGRPSTPGVYYRTVPQNPNEYSQGISPGQTQMVNLSWLAKKLGYTTGSPLMDLRSQSRLRSSEITPSGGLRPKTDYSQMENRDAQLGLVPDEYASAFGGKHPGSVEESYQTMPQDQILTNMLNRLLRGMPERN